MTYCSEWLESQVHEVPITFEERVQIKSTMCWSEVMCAVSTVTRLWVHRLLSGGSEERKVPALLLPELLWLTLPLSLLQDILF